MTVERQYIGARYVIKVYENTETAGSAEWQSNTSYEPLTMVTYQNSSYLSKKAVPPTVGNPADNPTFWVITGAYNGQISQLQQQIAQLQEQIDIITNASISVEKYGAKGDGVTNDTNAIQSAITNNSSVVIPDGTYLVSEPIQLHSNMTLICQGKINCTWSSNDETTYKGVFYGDNLENVTIVGANIEATTPTDSSSYVPYSGGIIFNSCENIIIKECHLKNIPFIAAILLRGCNGVIVENCEVDTFVYGGIMFENGTSNAKVNKCTIKNPTSKTYANTYPIMLNGYDHNYNEYIDTIGENLICTDNYIECEFPWWEGIDFHGGKNVVVTNNVVIGSMTGIACAGEIKATDVIISNNVLIGNKTGLKRNVLNSGIVVSLCENATVSGNIIKNFGYNVELANQAPGMYLVRSDDVIVENNLISECGNEDYDTYCIVVSECNTIIKNNVFENGDNLYVARFYNTAVSKDIEFAYNRIRKAATNFIDSHSMTIASDSRVHDNDTDVVTEHFSQYCKPQFMLTTPNSLIKVGKYGDIIFSTNATSGNGCMWLCTSPYDGTNNAVWTAVVNKP